MRKIILIVSIVLATGAWATRASAQQCPLPSNDGDNRCEDAVEVSLNHSEVLQIAPVCDHDWRTFEVPEGDDRIVEIETLSATPSRRDDDTNLALWRGDCANLEFVAYSEDSGGNWTSRMRPSLAPGRYFVDVGGWFDQSLADVTFRVTAIPCTPVDDLLAGAMDGIVRLGAGCYALQNPVVVPPGWAIQGETQLVVDSNGIPTGYDGSQATVIETAGLDPSEVAITVSEATLSGLVVRGGGSEDGRRLIGTPSGETVGVESSVTMWDLAVEDAFGGIILSPQSFSDKTLTSQMDGLLVQRATIGIVIGADGGTHHVGIENAWLNDNFAGLLPIGATDTDGGLLVGRDNSVLYQASVLPYQIEAGTNLQTPHMGSEATVCWHTQQSYFFDTDLFARIFGNISSGPETTGGINNTVRYFAEDVTLADSGWYVGIESTPPNPAGNDVVARFEGVDADPEIGLFVDGTYVARTLEDLLAQNSGIMAPSDPNVFTGQDLDLSVCGPLDTEVEIDIKPGSDPNCFNANGHGVIPVAVLGSDSFDVSGIEQTTLSFGGADVRVRGNKGPSCGLEDVNFDGFDDLVCHFEDNPDYWELGQDNATLTGELLDGTRIEGTDSICIVP